MAERIVWTLQARNERKKILNYWFERNGNKKYSRKLACQFRETVKYIAAQNYLGRATNFENIRAAVSGNYLILYRLSESILEVLTIFDSRRNPEDRSVQE